MSEDIKDVKNEEQTSSESSTEQKQTSETDGSTEEVSKKKGLKDYSQNDWDNQPESASLTENTSLKKEESKAADVGEEPEKAQNENKAIAGLENAKQKLIAELQRLREEKKAVRKETVDTTTNSEFEYRTEEESEKLDIDAKMERKFEEMKAKDAFYSAHPSFYQGETGVEMRQYVEEYIKHEYNPDKLSIRALNNLREMVHQQFFGNYEVEGKIRKAKTEERNRQIMNDMAASVSTKGQADLNAPKAPRRRILPIYTGPDKWY